MCIYIYIYIYIHVLLPRPGTAAADAERQSAQPRVQEGRGDLHGHSIEYTTCAYVLYRALI